MDHSTTVLGGNGFDSAVGRAHRVVDTVSEKAAPAVQKVAGAAHRTIDNVARRATPAADWLVDNGRQFASRSGEFAEVCSVYVRRRPIASIAGAILIGYIAGKILR